MVNTVTVHYHPAGFPNDITGPAATRRTCSSRRSRSRRPADALSKVGDVFDVHFTVTNTSSGDTPNLSCTIMDALLGVDKTVDVAPGAWRRDERRGRSQAGDPDPLVNTACVTCTFEDFPNVLARDSEQLDEPVPAVVNGDEER